MINENRDRKKSAIFPFFPHGGKTVTIIRKILIMIEIIIVSGKIDWPRHIDPVAKDLIKKFLVQVDPIILIITIIK